uniref:Uncharacterized protein n=1 Tax=Meloidogyne floridensis TaxID=298350 RepID=A0A915P802_9BILA
MKANRRTLELRIRFEFHIRVLNRILEPKTFKNVYRLLLPLLCPNYSIQFCHFIFIQNENLIEGICQQINQVELLALQQTNWIYNNQNNNNENQNNIEIIQKRKSETFNSKRNKLNKKDLNNNNIFNFEWELKNNKINKTLIEQQQQHSFDELPSLSILPELDDKDLDEFFRLVEQ